MRLGSCSFLLLVCYYLGIEMILMEKGFVGRGLEVSRWYMVVMMVWDG